MRAFFAVALIYAAAQPAFAHAQHLPQWLLVHPRVLAELEQPIARTPPPASVVNQTRAARITAAGAGFLLSSLVTLAYSLPDRSRCWEDSKLLVTTAPKVATGVGAVGLAMTVAGGSWLAVEAKKHGHFSSASKRWQAAGLGAFTFVTSQALLWGIFALDHLC